MPKRDFDNVLSAAGAQSGRADLTAVPEAEPPQESEPQVQPARETAPTASAGLREEIARRAVEQTPRYVEIHGKKVLADIHEHDTEVSMIARVPLSFRNVVQEYAKELGYSQNQFVLESCQLMIETIREARGE